MKKKENKMNEDEYKKDENVEKIENFFEEGTMPKENYISCDGDAHYFKFGDEEYAAYKGKTAYEAAEGEIWEWISFIPVEKLVEYFDYTSSENPKICEKDNYKLSKSTVLNFLKKTDCEDGGYAFIVKKCIGKNKDKFINDAIQCTDGSFGDLLSHAGFKDDGSKALFIQQIN